MLDKGFHIPNLRDVVVCGGKKYSCLLTRRVSNISLQEGNITLIHMTLLCESLATISPSSVNITKSIYKYDLA